MHQTFFALLLLPMACANSTPTTSTPATSASTTAIGSAPLPTASAATAGVADDGPGLAASLAHVLVPAPSPPSVPAFGAYRARLTDGYGNALQSFLHQGRGYVLGSTGERYRIHVSNPTPKRVEAVVSIDGLDAMDGAVADYVHKRGYIVAPYGEVDIEGFRTSLSQVATFRFAAVADSYAAKTGDARNVGVIGVAFFPERYVAPPAPPLYYPTTPPSDAEQKRSTDDLGRLAPAPKAASAQGGDSPSGRSSPTESRATERRPGLGTEFGEGRQSQVVETSFERANPAAPAQVFAVRYNNRAGLESLGIVFPPPPRPRNLDGELRENAQPFPQNTRFAQPPPR